MNWGDKDAMEMVGDRPDKLPAHADSRACVLPWYGAAPAPAFILVIVFVPVKTPIKTSRKTRQ